MSLNLPLQSCVQQYLIALQGYPLVMATETKPAVMLSVMLLTRVDIEKAYKIGLDIAKESSATLQGLWPWNLTNPNRDVEYLSFIADADSINSIIEKIKSSLKLTEDNLLYMITPSTHPKEKPPPSIMTT